MKEFNTILDQIEVAFSNNDVRGKPVYQNISARTWVAKIRECLEGSKEGSHWLRTTLKVNNDTKQCLGRSTENTLSLASVVVIDCDKRININGEEVEGAPDPLQVSQILKDLNLAHILHGSHSHYTSEKGHRYRIVLCTDLPYKKEQLAPTVESIISQINVVLAGLGSDLLANAIENSTWSQGWYCPRKPTGSKIETLYFENTEGQLVDVIDPLELPPTSYVFTQSLSNKPEQISVIHAFNEQRNIEELLSHYGYTRILSHKWLRPNSSSGIPGITIKGNKFYSHHADEFNDGYWHDCFDLWRVMEKLDLKDAIAKAAQTTYVPDGRTVDEFNKSLANKEVLPSNIKFNVYQPFDNKLLPVDDIPYGSLPEQMETFIKEQAEIRGCPPDFILISVLSRMGVLFAGKLKIAMTRHTKWHVTPNFFWIMVGPPSSGKSNALDATASFIKSISEEAEKVYNKNHELHKQKLDLLQRKLNTAMKGLDRENVKTQPEQNNVDIFETRIKTLQHEINILLAQAPKCKVYTVNRTTFEKLILIMKDNIDGIMLELDEVAPLFIRLSKDEHCEERGFYLTAYNGNGSYSYRTISRGTDYIERVIISIIGGTQPGKLERVVNEMKNNLTNDGFLQRFQGVVYPDTKIRLSQDKQGEEELERKWNILLASLNNMPPDEIVVRFDDEAQEVFDYWREETTVQAYEMEPHLSAHVGKSYEFVAALSVYLFLYEKWGRISGEQYIPVDYILRAIKLGAYFLSHAKRMYGLAYKDDIPARSLANKLPLLGSFFTRSQIRDKDWSNLTQKEDRLEAINKLIQRGYISTKTNGKYYINPEYLVEE